MGKILLLFTGGTIGSVKVYNEIQKKHIIMQPCEARKLSTDIKDSISLLLDEFKKKFPNYKEEFVTQTIMETLSENMTLDNWAHLTRSLKDCDFSEYEGIILTHGTDTLGYTANYLSMILSNIKVPLILVSSNYEITDPRANGIKNLKGAIDFIEQTHLPGVYVSYNYNNETKLIYGSRIKQCSSIVDDFSGISPHLPNMKPLAIIKEDGDININDGELYQKIISRCEKIDEENNLINKISVLNKDIMVINPYVGLNYQLIPTGNEDAILHTLYHSGTACSIGFSNYSVLNFIKKCKEKNIDLYFGPMYGNENRDIYSTTNEFNECDILMNTTMENAYVKLLIAYQLFEKKSEIKNFMYSDINEEHISKSVKLLKK